MTARRRMIRATGSVAAQRETVFSVLADLDAHEALTDRRVRVVELHGRRDARIGGLVRLHGPFGLTRDATTRVSGARFPHTLEGTARTPSDASAALRWRLSDDGPATRVGVEVEVQACSWSDRLLLAAGGAWWLRRRLSTAIKRLGEGVAAAPAAEQRRSVQRSVRKPRSTGARSSGATT